MALCEKYPNFSGPHLVRKRENTDKKKLRIWKLFTQCRKLENMKMLLNEK